MRKAGVSESVIMAITGHSTREMFDRYNTVDETDKRQAVDQLEVFFKNSDQIVTTFILQLQIFWILLNEIILFETFRSFLNLQTFKCKFHFGRN